MAQETEFARIKRAVELEKTKKMQAELKLESLNDEKVRLFQEANQLTGANFATTEDLTKYTDDLKADIEKDIKEMGETLKAEGVSY